MGIVRTQSIRNSIYFYIGLSLGALSTIVFYPNVFNSHPEHWGLIQIIVSYSIVLSTFSSLGSPKTLIRFFPKVKDKSELVTLTFLIPIIGFLFVFLFYLLFKDSIITYLKPDFQSFLGKEQDFIDEMRTYILLKDNLHLIFLLIASLSFFEVLSALSRSLLNATMPVMLREVFLKGMGIILLFLHWPETTINFDNFTFLKSQYIDFETYLYLYVLMYMLMAIILAFSIFSKFNYKIKFRFDQLETRKQLLFGLYVLGGGASAMLVSKLDMIMIERIIGYKEVAFYSIAFFIGNVVRIPGRAVGSIATPLIVKAWEKRDINQIKSIYVKSSINQFLLGGIIFLGVWLNIDDGLSLLPDKFQGGAMVVLFIALGQLFNVACGVNGIIIINSRYYKFDLYSNFILLIITIIANLIFIPKSSPLEIYDITGINGAAFATALSVFLYNIIKLIFVYIKIGIQPFTINTLKTIFLIVGVYLCIDPIYFSDNVIISLILRFSMLAILYLTVMILLRISDDINDLISDLWRKYFVRN